MKERSCFYDKWNNITQQQQTAFLVWSNSSLISFRRKY